MEERGPEDALAQELRQAGWATGGQSGKAPGEARNSDSCAPKGASATNERLVSPAGRSWRVAHYIRPGTKIRAKEGTRDLPNLPQGLSDPEEKGRYEETSDGRDRERWPGAPPLH